MLGESDCFACEFGSLLLASLVLSLILDELEKKRRKRCGASLVAVRKMMMTVVNCLVFR